jgi:hypothetical protein
MKFFRQAKDRKEAKSLARELNFYGTHTPFGTKLKRKDYYKYNAVAIGDKVYLEDKNLKELKIEKD